MEFFETFKIHEGVYTLKKLSLEVVLKNESVNFSRGLVASLTPSFKQVIFWKSQSLLFHVHVIHRHFWKFKISHLN